MATVAQLWRYPVKSMQGETLESFDVTPNGVVGDRAWAIVDDETGHVASAKHPRKWAALLHFAARTTDGGHVEITTPDGAVLRSDDDGVHAALSDALGRPVHLANGAPAGANYEMLFLDIADAAPADLIAATRTADEPDGTLTDQTVGVAAPGTFFDVAALHIVTTATLSAMDVDVRRLRPNVVVDVVDAGYVENAWAERALSLGAAGAFVMLPTMRCVMTTLPQPGIERDKGVLQRLATDNKLDLAGLGTWACAGVYAAVTQPGSVAVGDAFSVN
jgi:uncharacterized protein YcbX